MKEKRVGTLRYQVCQLDGLPMRWHGWHVIVWKSHEDHVILEGHYNSEVVGSCSDRSPGLGWRCDGVKPKVSSWVWSDLIHGACGILNEVGRVNLAQEMRK